MKRWVRAFCRGKVSATTATLPGLPQQDAQWSPSVTSPSLASVSLPNPTDFAPLDADRAALWQRYGTGDRPLFVNLVGLTVEEVRTDYCRLALAFRPELLQAGGAVHGGVIASLIDTACVPAVGSGFTEARPYSTIDLHIQYMGAAGEDDLVAAAWVTRRGRSIVFCDAGVETASGRVVARGSLTFKVS